MLLVAQIQDIASKSYLSPTYFRNLTDFVRSFVTQEKDKDTSPFIQFPNDYRLLFQYVFDETTGQFRPAPSCLTFTFNELLDAVYLLGDNGERLDTVRPTASIIERLYDMHSIQNPLIDDDFENREFHPVSDLNTCI
jgi:hypothetical protein